MKTEDWPVGESVYRQSHIMQEKFQQETEIALDII
jgi:hypothetical protein